MEREAIEGDSPVGKKETKLRAVPEYHESREISWESGGPTLQG